MTAVTNTGPLIALAKLNHLHLVPSLYEEVLIPQAVYRECVLAGRQRGYEDAEVIDAYRRGKLSADVFDELLAAIESREDI